MVIIAVDLKVVSLISYAVNFSNDLHWNLMLCLADKVSMVYISKLQPYYFPIMYGSSNGRKIHHSIPLLILTQHADKDPELLQLFWVMQNVYIWETPK